MDTTPTAPAIYEIPAHRLSVFQEKFAALQRRARKLGCPEPEATVGELAAVKRVEVDPLDGEEYVVFFEFYPVTVTGAAPRLNGWAFLAVVDYEGEAPIFRKTPAAADVELPVRYREMGPVCEHCQLSRGRKETFLLAHEDGRVLQVGRQCLKDFLGHDSPEHLAALACFEADVHTACGEEDVLGVGGMFGAGPFTPEVEQYVAWVVWSINRWGWLSRKASMEDEGGRPATATQAARAFEGYLKACKDGRGDRAAKPGDAEKARAAEVIAWARSIGEGEDRALSDYEHNLRTVCRLGRVGSKHFGLVASAVAAYDREVARRKAIVNEYVGTVGERIRDVRVFVERVIRLDMDEYGRSIVLFRDLAGHQVKWTTNAIPSTGKEYTMTATVKAHVERQGVFQTVVTRAELQADDEPTKGEVRAAERIDEALDRVEWRLATIFGWSGPARETFRARRIAARKDANVVELEALRVELHGLASVIEPAKEPKDDAERRFYQRARRIVWAHLAAIDPARKAPKLKPAVRAAAQVEVDTIRKAVDTIRSWPFDAVSAEQFTELANVSADDLDALRALRAECREYVVAAVPSRCAGTPESDARATELRAATLTILDTAVAVPQGANPAAAARLAKQIRKAAEKVRRWPLAGWEGADDFWARITVAEERADVVTLTAMRDELAVIIPTVQPDGRARAAWDWDEDLAARHRAEALGYLAPKAQGGKRAKAEDAAAPASA